MDVKQVAKTGAVIVILAVGAYAAVKYVLPAAKAMLVAAKAKISPTYL
jgi:hypothetical protein